MKIITSKKFNEITNKITDLQLELNSVQDDNQVYFKQVKELDTMYKTQSEELGKIKHKYNQLRYENQKLKDLLAKNGIEYKVGKTYKAKRKSKENIERLNDDKRK